MNINHDAKTMVTVMIDHIITKLHQKYQTKSGDISPDQQVALENLISDISSLIAQQVSDNMHESKELSVIKRLAGL